VRFPIIIVRDNDTGKEHIVGTDHHDSLWIDEETGGIHYLNLQCCEGTTKYDGKSTFEFVGVESDFLYQSEIRFVTFAELMRIYNRSLHRRGGTKGANTSEQI